MPDFPNSFCAAVWRARSRHRANARPPTALTRRHRRRDAAETAVAADRHQPPLAAPLCLPHQTGSTHVMCKRRIRSECVAYCRRARTPRDSGRRPAITTAHVLPAVFSVWAPRIVRGAFHHEVFSYSYHLPPKCF